MTPMYMFRCVCTIMFSLYRLKNKPHDGASLNAFILESVTVMNKNILLDLKEMGQVVKIAYCMYTDAKLNSLSSMDGKKMARDKVLS